MTEIVLDDIAGFSLVCKFAMWLIGFGVFCGLLMFLEWVIADKKVCERRREDHADSL